MSKLTKSFGRGVELALKVTVAPYLLLRIKRTQRYMSSANIPDGFTYTAHTGCCKTKPNTLECIDVGVKYGAQIVEFDLRFDENKEPVLSHDEPVGGEVTLDEAFAKISEIENLRVNVDVKVCTALEKVVALANKYGIADRIFFTGINEGDVKAVKEQAPTVEYYLNMKVKKPSAHTDAYLQSLVDKVKEYGAVGINFQYRSASRKLVDFFHKNGLLVSIFTVDRNIEMYRIISYGPDNITSRNPDLIKYTLEEFNQSCSK